MLHREKKQSQKGVQADSRMTPLFRGAQADKRRLGDSLAHLGESHSCLAHLRESHKDLGSPKEGSHSGGYVDSLLTLFLFSVYAWNR